MTAPASLIPGLLSDQDILCDLDVASKKRVFEQVGEVVERNHGIARSKVFDSLFAREKLGSTGLGQGVAIPHGRIKGLKAAIGVFVRTKEPIGFDAPDGQPVRLIFVMLVPEQATEQHLQILSELAQMFSDKPFRDRLAESADAASLHALLTGWTPYGADQRSTAV